VISSHQPSFVRPGSAFSLAVTERLLYPRERRYCGHGARSENLQQQRLRLVGGTQFTLRVTNLFKAARSQYPCANCNKSSFSGPGGIRAASWPSAAASSSHCSTVRFVPCSTPMKVPGHRNVHIVRHLAQCFRDRLFGVGRKLRVYQGFVASGCDIIVACTLGEGRRKLRNSNLRAILRSLHSALGW
jgi:hypothetical protein